MSSADEPRIPSLPRPPGADTARAASRQRQLDWFERLTGFKELGYAATQAQLSVQDGRLRSQANGQSHGIGQLTLPTVQSLREQAAALPGRPGRLRLRIAQGDVRAMHRDPAHQGALFQVASQFNMLEMVGPDRTPEDGVTRYASDFTQGPACAVAAGAATIYRNYFAPVDGHIGQTRAQQLDGLSDLGSALSAALHLPVSALWTMRNGYALCTRAGLDAIQHHLDALEPSGVDALRGLLRIGLHRDVEVTDGDALPRPVVSQAFCSALPVAYGSVPRPHWKAFGSLILEAAYEATVWAAVLNAQRVGGSPTVLLTLLGGGAFGNPSSWIDAALRRALDLVRDQALDVVMVSYGAPSAELLQLKKDYA